MNPHILNAFADELEKIAGIGLYIYGYSKNPEVTDAQREKFRRLEERRQEAVGMKAPSYEDYASYTPREGFFNKLLRRKKKTYRDSAYRRDLKAYDKKYQEAVKKHPGFEFENDYVESLRVGPKDETGGRLTAAVLGEQYDILSDLIQYDEPESRLLTRKDLDDVRARYIREMPKWDQQFKGTKKYHDRFLERIDALKKDKRAKFYRLEFE